MLDYLSKLFDTEGFPPRWKCGQWTSGHGWLHILSDLGIWAAYFAIPVILVVVASKRPDVPFRKIFLLFGSFILACGSTHFLEAVIFWQPVYRFAGVVKLATALISWATIAALINILPAALTLKTPAMLEQEVAKRTNDLEVANAALHVEVKQRHELSDELRRVAADLSEANRRKSEFLAVLAHELRNPLTPLCNTVEILKLANCDPAMVNDVIATLERQTVHMVHLVDDLLDVARINQGRFLLKRQTVALEDVLRTAIEAVRPLLDAGQHTLTYDPQTKPICVDGDPTRLAQIFVNLLGNATKYTDRGGRIAITLVADEREAIVTVRDNGQGIPPDQQERVFELFAQLDRPQGEIHAGLGIGLTLVKRLTELHDGLVQIDSLGDGMGTAVTIRLPTVEAPQSSQVVNAIRPREDITRRILVVDDNPDVAMTLQLILQRWGHEVVRAHDGVEAIEAARIHRPDVIFMDIGMPRLNGYEAAAAIRREDWGRSMVLIALSGWGQHSDKEKALQAGFNRHYVKPAPPSDLRSAIDMVNDASRSA